MDENYELEAADDERQALLAERKAAQVGDRLARFPDRWQNGPYGLDDIQLQAFVDNACTCWLDVLGILEGTDEEVGKKFRAAVQEQLDIANS